MKPLEIRYRAAGSWFLLAGLPILAWDVKVGWTNLLMTSFADHPLRFAGALVFGMFDVFVVFAVAIPCLCSIWRSRRTIVVSDDGIESKLPGTPAESIAWNDLAELKSVKLFGGIDALDSAGHLRVRLPGGYVLLNKLVPAIDYQLREHPLRDADHKIARPRRGLILGLYAGAGCFLFLAYAALMAKTVWLLILFALAALLLVALSAALQKSEVSLFVGEGLLKFEYLFFAPRVYRLETITEIKISAISPILYVQLLRREGRPLGILLLGRNNILWYRSLRSAWEETQTERQHGATS